MNYKQSVLNDNNNIRKQNLNITASSETYKDVNKHYKAINFSLIGHEVTGIMQNKKKLSCVKPLRIIVLEFNAIKKCKSSYNVDVSCFFNKPLKSVILKYSKRVQISKQFANWVKPCYTNKTTKKQSLQGGLTGINNIMGSDISMYEYELYVDLKLKNVPLTKTNISYIIAQTLCKTRRIKKSYQASYAEHTGILGAFILKNGDFRNSRNHPIIGYYISDYELKQCALANFNKKQPIEVTQWSLIKKNETAGKYNNLLGDTATGKELVRTSTPAESGCQLVKNLQLMTNVGTLSSLQSPLYTLVNLLTKIETFSLL